MRHISRRPPGPLPCSLLLLALAASVASVAGESAGISAPRGLYVAPAGSSRLAAPEAIEAAGLVALEEGRSLEDALAGQAGLEVVLLHPETLESLDRETLHRAFRDGVTLAALNTPVSRLADSAAVEIGLGDLEPRKEREGLVSLSLLQPLFTDGELDGHLAFTDFVSDFRDVHRVLALTLGWDRPGPSGPELAERYECVTGPADQETAQHPNGGSILGWVQTSCFYDSVNGVFSYWGEANTFGSSFEYVKLTMTTWTNCDYWHQIASIVKQHPTNASVKKPAALLAGTPSCGSKWQTNAVHGAKKGSILYSFYNSSCAGSGC